MDRNNNRIGRVLVAGIITIFIISGLLPVINGSIIVTIEYNNTSNNDTGSSSTVDWWPMPHHDLENSGYSTSKAPNTNYTCWNFSDGNSIADITPVVVNDKIYFSTYSTYLGASLEQLDDFSMLKRSEMLINGEGFEGCFYCLNAKTGEQIWDFETEIVSATASVVDDCVYFGTVDIDYHSYQLTGKIYCLDAESGDKIWNITIDTPRKQDCVLFNPIVSDGSLYITEQYGRLHCFNADDGSHIWTIDLGYSEDRQNSRTCVVVDDKVYVNTGIIFLSGPSGHAYCFDAITGDELWNYSIGRNDYWSPSFVDGKVLVNGYNFSVSESILFCINSTSGELIWKTQYKGADAPGVWSTPAIAHDCIYVLCYDYLVCFDLESGVEKWRKQCNKDDGPSSASIADGKIYYGTGKTDKLYCRNAENGSLIWSYQVGNAVNSPSIADGWVYIAANGATWTHAIYAFRDNEPPDLPLIDGPIKGKPRIDIQYTFVSIDFEGDNIDEYTIDWGDGTNQEIIKGSFSSGEVITANHTWIGKGTYMIKAKAKDIYGAEGNWSYFNVEIPRTRANPYLWYEWLLERFPMLERLLNLISYT